VFENTHNGEKRLWAKKDRGARRVKKKGILQKLWGGVGTTSIFLHQGGGIVEKKVKG